MQTKVESEQGSCQDGKAVRWFVYPAALLGVMALMATGAQFAFLFMLPHLATFVRDPQALWLIFSTWPEVRFGTFSLLLLWAYPVLSGVDWKILRAKDMLRKLHGMDQRMVAAFLAGAVLLLLLLVLAQSVVLYLASLVLCAMLGALVFIWAARIGLPLRALWLIAALAIGFFGNLLMSGADHRPFACRTGRVQLRGGEILPCRYLVWLSGKPLWIVEGPQPPRLILRRDIDDAEVDRTLGPVRGWSSLTPG